MCYAACANANELGSFLLEVARAKLARTGLHKSGNMHSCIRIRAATGPKLAYAVSRKPFENTVSEARLPPFKRSLDAKLDAARL